MKELKFVVHQNYVTDKLGTVFCKKNNMVEKLTDITSQCCECSYFYGCLQGEGVECGWEDVVDVPFWSVTNPHEELNRVSMLITEKSISED